MKFDYILIYYMILFYFINAVHEKYFTNKSIFYKKIKSYICLL